MSQNPFDPIFGQINNGIQNTGLGSPPPAPPRAAQTLEQHLKEIKEAGDSELRAMKQITNAKPEAVCLEAHRTIHGPRRQTYGPVSESFERVAQMWGVILKKEVTSKEVALCMVALKISREINAHHRDNLVDICGYADLCQQLHEN